MAHLVVPGRVKKVSKVAFVSGNGALRKAANEGLRGPVEVYIVASDSHHLMAKRDVVIGLLNCAENQDDYGASMIPKCLEWSFDKTLEKDREDARKMELARERWKLETKNQLRQELGRELLSELWSLPAFDLLALHNKRGWPDCWAEWAPVDGDATSLAIKDANVGEVGEVGGGGCSGCSSSSVGPPPPPPPPVRPQPPWGAASVAAKASTTYEPYKYGQCEQHKYEHSCCHTESRRGIKRPLDGDKDRKVTENW